MRSSKTKKASVAAESTVAYLTTKGKQAVAKKIKPLTDADWVRPGRPATDEEMEQLAEEMMKETEWFTPEEVMASVKKSLAEWRNARK
jgi:hypothetical protein